MMFSFDRRFNVAGWVAAIGLCSASSSTMALTVAATYMSEAGNGGYSAVTQFGSASAAGSYTVPPLSGTGFLSNTTEGAFTISSQGGPLQTPTLTAFASGSDDGTLRADGAFTSIGIHYTYNFAVTGPETGLAVPIVFFVATTGSSTFSGNSASRSNSVGTEVRVIAPLVGSTFQSVGLASGTAPGVYGNGQYMIVGWGASSPLAINYDSYNAVSSYGFTVLSGDPGSGVQTFEISTSVVGGTTGTTTAPGVASTGSVTSMIDPYIYIDPAWLTYHPGYSVVVDADVGNGVVSSVPEPLLAWTLLMGLPLVSLMSRKRRRGLTTVTAAVMRVLSR